MASPPLSPSTITQEDDADDIPLPSEQPLEVGFIENHVDDYRDINGNQPAWYNNRRGSFVERRRTVTFRERKPSLELEPQALQKSKLALVSTTESFSNAIDVLKKEKSGKKDIARFELLSNCHDWSEVAVAIQKAETTYKSEDSVSGKFRNAFRRVGDNAKSIQSFVGLLPDGSYKTLCGGLTLVLTAMMKHSEVRERMAELLDELPDFIKDCEDYARLYQGKNILQLRIQELYVELLAALEEVVRWYTQPSRKRITQSLFKNSLYGQAIDKRIENIQKCKTRFHAELEKFKHLRLRAIHETETETNAVVWSTNDGVSQLSDSFAQWSVKDEARYKKAEERERINSRKMSDATMALNGIKSVLGDVVKTAEWHGQRDKLIEELRREKERNERMDRQLAAQARLLNNLVQTPKSLASRLNLDLKASAWQSDISHVHSTGLNESIRFQARSRWLAEAPTFQKWLSKNKSQALFVQGNAELEGVSAFSYLDVLLYEKLVEAKSTLVLSHFCGIHAEKRSLSGPLAFMRALLSQLLSLHDVDWNRGDGDLPYLAFIGKREMSELEDGSYSAHLSTISQLLSSFLTRYDSVFLIVDGLDYLDSSWAIEVKKFFRSMAKLVRDSNSGRLGVLKVLVTVSTHLECVPEGKGFVALDASEDLEGDEEGFEGFSGED